MGRRRSIRYTLILASVALGTALAAAGGWRYARASAPLTGPIILISIDAVRADHLPAYGYQRVKTPAIDLLAANGVVFARAYAHATETLPSLVSLLSGRLPFETGVRTGEGERVKPGERLLSQMLRDRGYRTGAVVSTAALGKDTGIAQGFEFFDDTIAPAPSEGVEAILSDSPATERDSSESEALAEKWLTDLGTSRAFLFLHLNAPHPPSAPPERLASDTQYDGEIATADEVVGKLIRYLKTHQLYDRSTIVLLSDHGEGLGDHGEQAHGLFVYDEAIHVPLIVKQEGNEQAGRHVADLVQQIDIVPTILDLVKAPIPSALRGQSLKPLLEDGGGVPARPIYAESQYGYAHFGWSGLRSVTDGHFQYIRAPREELYDLDRDPRERHNLLEGGGPPAADAARARAALAASLDRITGTGSVSEGETSTEPLPDPKDGTAVVELYRRAMQSVADRQWAKALGLLQDLVARDPTLAEGWSELGRVAAMLGRSDQALEAWKHVMSLRPAESSAYLSSADVLIRERKLDEARTLATATLDAAPKDDIGSRARAHEALARIALARRDADEARSEAAIAQQLAPNRPLASFVEGRILYDQGKYEDALPEWQKAEAGARSATLEPIADLHFYAGDTLQRLNRPEDAEREFVAELHTFPHNVRAAAALAALYNATGRGVQAAQLVARLLTVTPSQDAYATAARLLRSFGNRREADAVRAESRRLFGDARR